MTGKILKLFPPPYEELPIRQLYLDHNLRDLPSRSGVSLVYSNYIASIDGRIAVTRPGGDDMMVPKETSNPRDWRLFQELAIQADILLTSGRYLRDYAQGNAQEILRVYDDPAFADLKDWRTSQGLSPHPAIAVISASLDFTLPDALLEVHRQVIVVTSRTAEIRRVEELQKKVDHVIFPGDKNIEASQMVQKLGELGYRLIYNATGPKVHHLLLSAGLVDRIYLTVANRLLGGSPFSSIVEGPILDPPADFRMQNIYYDPFALDEVGQLFIVYQRR